MESKRCPSCGEMKLASDFNSNRSRSDGRAYACRVCTREYNRAWVKAHPEVYAANQRWREQHREQVAAAARRWRAANREKSLQNSRRYRARQYGLTLEEYEAMIAKGCSICGTHERVHMDHDHANGKVRAALCTDCNQALGRMVDDPVRLRRAADYIEEWKRKGTG